MSNADLDDRGVIVLCPNCGQRNRVLYGRLSDPLRCGQCKRELGPPSEPVEIRNAAAFDRVVANASVPVVVDYWAPWCGPCRMVAPELAKVAARQAGKFLVLKVNTDAIPELGERFKIRSIPTMAVFGGGREVGRASGARPAADIESFIESTLARR